MNYNFIITNNEIYLNYYHKLTWQEFIERIKKDEAWQLKFNINVEKDVTTKIWIKNSYNQYQEEERSGCVIISFN